MKKILLISFGILVIFIISIILFQKPKDKCICKDGQWIRFGSPTTSQPTTPCTGKRTGPELPAIPPDSAVVSLYTWILKEDDVIANEAYKKSPYLADSFKQIISQKKSSNPFFCQDKPLINYKILKSSTNQTKATVTIEQTFEAEKVTVPLELQAVNKKWIITAIKCP